MAEEEKPKEEAQPKERKKPEEINQVIIRPWPKMVFLYPLLILSLVFGLLRVFLPDNAELSATLAVYWLLVFGFNLFIMAFEFNRLRSITILSLVVALVVILLYVGKETEISLLSGISGFVIGLEPGANARFYFGVAITLGIMFLIMFIHTRFDYWEVTHNELRHYHGILGNVERYPAPHLRFTKEINDVVEFVLMLSGTLVLFPASESRTIHLDNVPHINRIEKHLEHLLSRMAVDIDMGGP